jgi:hypothetical protein
MSAGAFRFAPRWLVAALVSSPVLLAAATPAHAIFLSENNGHATLGGSIEAGDGERFRAFLAQPRAVPIRVLWLESGGGQITASIDIARQVRKAKLTTAVRASNRRCDSGCTFIFVAGAKRHYVGGADVHEGLSSFSGLGFHSASQRGDAVRFTLRSDEGNQRMSAFYREMGVPGAAELVQRAPFNAMYRINGQTALRLRIATSLAEP